MSRVSIARRIERIRAHYRPTSSLEGRADRLTPEHRAAYDQWRSTMDAIILSYENHEPGFYFENLVNGTLARGQPELPAEIHEALFPEYRWSVINGDDVEAAYDAMLHPEDTR